jgi:hypothetical protein
MERVAAEKAGTAEPERKRIEKERIMNFERDAGSLHMSVLLN